MRLASSDFAVMFCLILIGTYGYHFYSALAGNHGPDQVELSDIQSFR